ncbi:hypothetical protein F5883DRAFT_656822 [Diaporthe sp. PMI_573]|nr:hypothetical protein F5883DRAFT_656822 [Diaporthaceae sp. PMI_573]
MQSTILIKTLRDRLYESFGLPCWKNHDEAPQLLEWVRTVEAIHSWLEEANEHHERLVLQLNQETENFQLPENYIHERFGEVYRCLDAMDPYLPKTLRDGTTHDGRLEEVTRRIVNELWSGNVYWLDFFQG